MDRVYNKLSTISLIYLQSCRYFVIPAILQNESSFFIVQDLQLLIFFQLPSTYEEKYTSYFYQYFFTSTPSFPPPFFPIKVTQKLSSCFHVSIGCTLEKCNLRLILWSLYSIQQLGTQVPRLCTTYFLLHHCQLHTRNSLTDIHILLFYPVI